MGGAVSIVSPTSRDAVEIKSILEDKEKFNVLFKEMSTHGHSGGHIDLKDKISMPELILFVENGGNALISRVCVSEPLVLKESFDFACTSKKKNHDHKLTKKEFRKLLPTLVLFSHFWRIFEVADSSIDDKRVFKHEYITAKHTIESIDGVTVAHITDESWLAEFETLDKNKNGYITFHEFCKYAVKSIIDPKFYMDGIQGEEAEEEDAEEEEEEEADGANPDAATDTNLGETSGSELSGEVKPEQAIDSKCEPATLPLVDVAVPLAVAGVDGSKF
jgi:Ca2+-binding EF-hand superfamily protein